MAKRTSIRFNGAMHILVICCISDPSELSLFKGLVANGDRLTLVCDPKEPQIEALRALGIKVFPLSIRNRFDLKAIWRLKALTKQEKIDVVYAPTNRALSTFLLASLGAKQQIVTYRGTMGHLSRLDPASHFAHLNRRVNKIVCNCDAVRRYLLSVGVKDEKLSVVYKGHDPAWYTELPAASRSALGFSDDQFLIAFMGNIRPVKGLNVLIEALSILTSKLKIKLLVMGEDRKGAARAFVKCQKLEHLVKFFGFRSDAVSIAAACDLLVVPSLDREGVPRVILQAMARRLPVLASSVGGIPEIISDGKCGALVPPGDVTALADKILELASSEDLRVKYADAAEQELISRFGVEDYVAEMRRVLA